MSQAIRLDLEAHKLIEAHRNSLEESQLSIIKRVFKSRHQADRKQTSTQSARSARPRETGKFMVRLGERTTVMGSQKTAYTQLLEWLDEEHPGLFETLAQEPSSRGRRIVARSKADLYAKADLQMHASPVASGWFADLNLSRVQKIQRLRKVCTKVGLTYGIDADAGL